MDDDRTIELITLSVGGVLFIKEEVMKVKRGQGQIRLPNFTDVISVSWSRCRYEESRYMMLRVGTPGALIAQGQPATFRGRPQFWYLDTLNNVIHFWPIAYAPLNIHIQYLPTIQEL